MAKILIVEDEAVIAEAVSAYLQKEGHRVTVELTGTSAADRIDGETFDLVVLDLMLPGISGEDLCRRLRRKAATPVLMLTAKSDETSLISGFRIGADDYMTKPFSPRELVVRVEAILRRAGGRASADIIEFGEGRFKADLKSRCLYRDGELIHLTPIEFDLLEKLMSYPDRIFSREEIISSCMGCDFDGTDRTVDSHIRNLRSKIEEDRKNPRFILTQRGKGFYFHA